MKAVLTDNGREFCGTENHPYELYLDLNDIEHRRTKVRSPKTNGFVERFNRTVLDEFFRVKMRETVISPFLAGCIRRTYAAIFSFIAGVMPPMPMFGRSLLYVQSHCVA